MYQHTKTEVSLSSHSKVKVQTNRHTERHKATHRHIGTDRQYENITFGGRPITNFGIEIPTTYDLILELP